MIRDRGFSLVEIILAMLVIAVTISGFVSLVGLVRNSSDPILVKQAESIAEALMDEVRLAGFTWCDPGDVNFSTATSSSVDATGVDVSKCKSLPESMGPEAGNVRPYDNVNDYNVFCSTPLDPITDITGASPISFSGYAANICMTPYGIDLATTSGVDITNAAALRIDITVSRSGANVFTLTGWRTRYAPNAS